MSQTEKEMRAELEKLRAENAQLKEKRRPSLTLKVGKAGGVSLYGIGRFPATFYKTQWEKILGHKEQILAFINAHESELKVKE